MMVNFHRVEVSLKASLSNLDVEYVETHNSVLICRLTSQNRNHLPSPCSLGKAHPKWTAKDRWYYFIII